MKPEEIRVMSIEEIKAKERDLAEELFNLRLRHTTGQVENPLRLRYLKRDIARVKTILAEKEREA